MTEWPTVRVAFLLICTLIFATRPASATPVPVVAPASGEQGALQVWVDRNDVRAEACPKAPCSAAAGMPLGVPPEAQSWLAAAELRVLLLYEGRHAVHVVAVDPRGGRQWEAIVAAPLGAGAPKVIFRGFTGLLEGELGERQGPMVWVSDQTRQGKEVAIGTQREDIELCGRQALLAPSVLRAKDLTLRRAKLQRLRASERVKAQTLTAVPSTGGLTGVRLQAQAASSALGAPQALTDGRLETSWSEDRSGEGRGEFVTMSANRDVSIRALRFALRPTANEPPHGGAPREFWVAMDGRLYKVALPSDGWSAAGTWFEVALPEAVKTSCVGLVTESSFSADPEVAVTFAEFALVTEFEAGAASALVSELASPSRDTALAAMAKLRSGGELAIPAIVTGFSALDEAGQGRALEILADAACEPVLPVYVDVLLSADAERKANALSRLGRCGPGIADAFASEFQRRSFPERRNLAYAFASIAPAKAVEVLVPSSARANPTTRSAFREAIRFAASRPASRGALLAALGNGQLSPVARLDLLRALGPALSHFLPVAGQAFDAALVSASSFRTSYSLLEVAAGLERVYPRAKETLEAAFRSKNAHLRLRAAQVAPTLVGYEAPLTTLLADPEVRVREASIMRLGALRASRSIASLATLLDDDPWPLVRAASATAMTELGPSQVADAALVTALGDASPDVRRPVLYALANRDARTALPAVRERLLDAKEDDHVRAAAASALATLCDYESVDELTGFAESMAKLSGSESERIVARASLAALGRLQPPDLKERLAPFFGKDVPRASVAAARDALTRGPSHCARPRPVLKAKHGS